MILFADSSGLSGFLADVREFLDAVRFTRPAMLWLLVAVPVLAVLLRIVAKRRRRAAVSRIGKPTSVAALLSEPTTRRRWLLALASFLGWVLLIFGAAGPRWGKSDETGVAVGRDVVIVIDLSGTMQADDMADGSAKTRWEAARNAALDLVNGMSRRGGHRVAVVVFAARTKLLCPLTTDYDHARAIIADIDGNAPPPEIGPVAGIPVISGTRIGAGLIAALNAHDSRFPGYQDIVLISDGDDPGDDKEWIHGTDEARKAGIPVHTVGVGNPDTDAILTFPDELVPTRLQESPLKQIAAETRGQYVAARTQAPQLAEFFHDNLEPLPNREVSDESVPLPKERYLLFLAPALAFFAIGWLRGR